MADKAENQTSSLKLNSFLEKKKKGLLGLLIALIVCLAAYIVISAVNNNIKEKNLAEIEEISYTLTHDSASLDESELNARRIDAIDNLAVYAKKGGIVGARANYLCAELTYQQKKYSESAEYWKETAKKAKKSYLAPIAYFNLAACNEELGQTDEAAANYKLAADSKDFVMREHAMFSYARVMETKGDYTEASAVYTELYDKYSDSEWANLAKSRLIALKNDGKIQSSESFVNAKESERQMMETELLNRVQALCEHAPMIGLEPHRMPYTEMQKKLFAEITERLRSLQKNDKELAGYLKEYEEAKSVSDSLSAKLQNAPEAIEVSKGDIDTEYNTVRQMAKMTVGRQGNQFPVFTREFYHCIPKGTGFREQVINIMSWIEEMDPGAFCRIHKNTPHRIVPYVLLVPTYGDFGFCWEPFDRYNRITSRGRIVVPMYPRDLKISLLMAVADLRWQVAKEKASYYWMEEGLTGQYYQWIENQKLKGDLKSYFISDYVLWMTKEVEGVQRMDKELRAIFWRFIPFNQEKKEELKKRSLVYQELYQRDINRSMSDGY